MKKSTIFFVLFLVFGVTIYSQTWAVYLDSNWDMELTVITHEQFNRIVTAQETTASFALLVFTDAVQAETLRVTRGSRPNFNGYYYLSIKYIPKTDVAKNYPQNILACVRYGNTRTGFMHIEFLSSIDTGTISLRFNRNEYIRQKNQLIELINGE
jgi:hypothetical protein